MNTQLVRGQLMATYWTEYHKYTTYLPEVIDKLSYIRLNRVHLGINGNRTKNCYAGVHLLYRLMKHKYRTITVTNENRYEIKLKLASVILDKKSLKIPKG